MSTARRFEAVRTATKQFGARSMTDKTQTFDHPDGGSEIVRVLDRLEVDHFDSRDPLAYEASIRWLVSLDSLDFVRTRMVKKAQSRRGRIRLDSYDVVVVGYAILQEDAPKHRKTNGYCRRVFYLSEEDNATNLNAFPVGALDPSTITPGATGESPPFVHIEAGYPVYMRRSEVMDRQHSRAPTLDMVDVHLTAQAH
jgi:hypothetical protein